MMERNTERLSTSWRESGCGMYTYREEGVRMGTMSALGWARTGRREAGGGDVELGTTLVLAVARTERREAGCGDGDDIRACCSRYGEEGRRRRRWGWLLHWRRVDPSKEEGSASRSCGGGGDGGAACRVDKEASCPRTEVRDGLSA